MKTFFFACLAAAAAFSFSACTTVKTPHAAATTEEIRTLPAAGDPAETRTVRTY